MRDQEKQILLKHYAQATGAPLQEVKSMQTQTAHEPEYHNMAAGDEAAAPEAMDVENAAFQHMFEPPVDVRHEDLHKQLQDNQ